MCGIAGILDLDGEPLGPEDEAVLRDMVESLAHRGPDESGVYRQGPLALGHARLSIIDLATGSQPLGNEDGAVMVSFNGEIFNYPELTRELKARGHVFRTTSDTEVIVHAFEEQGERCLESFNGQFALALWDQRSRTLLLARDRVGICPLFHAVVQAAGRRLLLFASEIKALLAHPVMARRLDVFGLCQLFTLWAPVPPRTTFEGVSELPAGCRMVVRAGSGRLPEPVRWWEPDFAPAGQPLARGLPRVLTEDEQAQALAEVLEDAVRIRLRADVDVGVYLSGGLDSSCVASLARERLGARLKTFSVGFENPAFDETAHQEEMVRYLGTDHFRVRVGAGDVARALPRVVFHAERPTLRTAPAPLMHLSGLARANGCKVVLTGEGADEFWAGYNIFKEAKIKAFWAKRPGSTIRPLLLRRLYPYLGLPRTGSAAYLARIFGDGLEDPGHPFFSHLVRWRTTSAITGFFSAEVKEALAGFDPLEDLRRFVSPELASWDHVSRAQYLEACLFLPGYLLSTQGDRMLMANSVEGRFPFLDHRVIELAASIPARTKLKGLDEKHVLKRAVRGLLPESVRRRVKQPYRAPAVGTGPADQEQAGQVLSRQALVEAGYFSPDMVLGLVAKLARGAAVGERDAMAMTGILSTQLLHQMFIKDRGACPAFPQDLDPTDRQARGQAPGQTLGQDHLAAAVVR